MEYAMDDSLIIALGNQYQKAFNLLIDVVNNYDDMTWCNCNDYQITVNQIIYHAIFYTNIYCSPNEKRIIKWNKEKEHFHDFKKMRQIWERREEERYGYYQNEMIEYAKFVLDNIPGYLLEMKPDEHCWPSWYEENQLEFQLNNLRHLQHHIGEVIERHDIVKKFEYKWQ
jgi:hypothetical protein